VSYLKSIRRLLNNKGYFAFCLPVDKDTKFSYTGDELIMLIISSNILKLLSFDELTLGRNNKYCICVCRAVG
jgi:hypothetical protein